MAKDNERRPATHTPVERIRRTATGIPGLDTILRGGLLSRATHLITGTSGSGKTVLTQQIAYYQAKQGNPVLYLTLLSEMHEKMIGNLSSFSFFEEELVGTLFIYLSLYQQLAAEGLSLLTPVSIEEARKHKAKLVILDGVSSLRDFAPSPAVLRKALFDFNAELSALGCTVLLLVDDEMYPPKAPEYAIADSIIRLRNQTKARRHIRSLEIVKSRATPALTGLHSFDITKNGLVVFPRIEVLLASQQQEEPAPAPTRHAFGIAGLDRMLGGGLLSNSINLLLGTPGSGKTLTGLRFIYEGARQDEKTMILSLHHSLPRILFTSSRLGFDLTPFLENSSLLVQWLLPVERVLDDVAGQLVEAISRHRPSRLLIDSFSELEVLSLNKKQLPGFWAALSNFLRTHQVTTVGTLEFNQIVGTSLVVPERPVSVIADSILLLRSLEIKGQLKRLISVLEMRDSDYDSTVREYLISTASLSVGEPFVDAEGVLSGTAHIRSSNPIA